MNEPSAALHLLGEARVLSPPDGHRGGCPSFQASFFSAAVTLMRLRNQWENASDFSAANLGLMTCDEHLSVANELTDLGLPLVALKHLTDAAAFAVEQSGPRRSIGAGRARDWGVSAHTDEKCTHSASAISLHDSLTCPHYFESSKDIGYWRTRIESRMLRMAQRCHGFHSQPARNTSVDGEVETQFASSLKEHEITSYSVPGTFDLVYMGLNDAALAQLVASTYACLQPKLSACLIAPPPRPTSSSSSSSRREAREDGSTKKVVRRRVGFLSAHFRRHSVCKLWCGMIAKLREPGRGFEVHVILASGDQQDEWTNAVSDVSSNAGDFFCKRSSSLDDDTASSSQKAKGVPKGPSLNHGVLRIANQAWGACLKSFNAYIFSWQISISFHET
jgi:hypothetical protein